MNRESSNTLTFKAEEDECQWQQGSVASDRRVFALRRMRLSELDATHSRYAARTASTYKTQRERVLERLLAEKDAEIALLRRRLAIYEPLPASPDEEPTPFDRNNEVPVSPRVC